jgi:Tat protein translocase TatB subunit
LCFLEVAYGIFLIIKACSINFKRKESGSMFGLGLFEIIIITVVALVFVGPKDLPIVMGKVAKFFVQIKRMANEMKSTFDSAIEKAEQEENSQQKTAAQDKPTGGEEFVGYSNK